MYNRILVALVPDQSRPAQRALEAARALCSPGGRIVALHVVEEVSPYVETYLGEQHLEKASAQALVELSDVIKGIEKAEPVVVVGHAARTILEYAGQNNVDCIVVASHRPEFADYLIGSTAGRVVRHAECSVHVVR
ncbi:universal stress protein [Marinovum sp.]|uniref:universal stress protein n=1 Tax=Marinovum sp. TaxID=2024839 RepID=UPI003A94E7DF